MAEESIVAPAPPRKVKATHISGHGSMTSNKVGFSVRHHDAYQRNCREHVSIEVELGEDGRFTVKASTVSGSRKLLDVLLPLDPLSWPKE